MLDVSRWLAEQGLGHHAEAFAANGIADDVLRDLTDADLKELGLNLGDRKRLLKAIAALHGPLNAGRFKGAEPTTPVVPRDAERRQLTLMFVDLVGSTMLSQRLDPEEMGQVLRQYQNAVAGEVMRFEGHIARFMGDGVLAYFGWPQAREDAAERAVRAGLAAVKAVGRLATPQGIRLAARVGIATGLVVVGQLIEAGSAREEEVVGETPNLAARLQAIAEPAGVVIADETRRLLGGLFELRALGPQMLKGLSAPVPVFTVVGESRIESRFEALHGQNLTPLVGREQELALLLDRWQQARNGEGQVVLLAGEAGIGKSRLVWALRQRLGAEPRTSLRYQCSPHHAGTALWPVMEQLERAAGITRDEPPHTNLDRLESLLGQAVGEVGMAAALVADLLGLPAAGRYPPRDLTPQRRKALTFEALLGQLVGLAARGPVLAVLEDAQWIDPTSQELFEQVVARTRRLPMLLVITFRLEFCAPWVSEPHAVSLTLARFGRKHAGALAERVAGGPLPAEVLAQILAKTEGVPLFLEELTKTVLETGLLEERDGRYLLDGPLPAVAIPATLSDSLMARLDRLAAAKEVAQFAAVIGREFSHELLVAVADRSADDLDAALRRLIEAELIFRRGIQPNTVYAFKHALVRDAAYESLLKTTRQRLHARIARALEQHFEQTVAARPDLVAYHYAQAGLIREAVPHYLQAGRNAVMRSATIEATDQLKAGLKLLEAYPDRPERARMELGLQIALGDALRAAKGSAVVETGAAYARARSLAMLLDAKVELIRATHGEFNFHFNRAEINRARETAGSLIEVANELGEIEARSIGLEAAGLVAFSSGDLLSARALLEKVLLIRSHDSETTLTTYAGDAASMSYLSWTLLIMGYPKHAERRCQQALEKGESSKQAFTLALALANSCYFHHLSRNWSALRRNCKCLIDLASEKMMPGWLETGLAFRGLTLAKEGQLSDGIRLIKYSLAEASSTRFVIEQPYFLSHLAEAYSSSGRFGKALQTINDALERVSLTGERWFEAELHRLKGEFALRLPAPDKGMADVCLGQALGIAKDQSARWWELRAATPLARLWAEQGDRQKAHDLLAPVYGWFTEGFDTPDLIEARDLLDALA